MGQMARFRRKDPEPTVMSNLNPNYYNLDAEEVKWEMTLDSFGFTRVLSRYVGDFRLG